jgi:sodium/potassium/calcium exchanger 6
MFETEGTCSLKDIENLNGGDSCQNALDFWQDFESIFDFNQMHFCDLNSKMYITIPIWLLILFISFYVLGSTADDYLSPALAKISETFGMSESLAGVTLLALGNGAPDVITAIAAGGGEEGGVFLAVGSLMGGGLFISGIVSAVVIFASSKPIHLLGRTMIRDIVFYIIALLILLSWSLVGEINIYYGISFLLLYVIYVVYVVIQDKIDEKIKNRHIQEKLNLEAMRGTEGWNSEYDESLYDLMDAEDDAYLVYENDQLVDVEFDHGKAEDHLG